MARGPIVVSDNAYGSPGEESQRGPRLRHSTKRGRVQRPYPKGGRRT